MKNQITVSKIEVPDIEISPEIVIQKQDVMRTAFGIKSVSDATEQESAVGAMKEIKSLTRGVESSRKIVKEPVLEIGRKIDGIAKDFCNDLEEEYSRLDKMVSAFQKHQLKIQEEARRAAEAARMKAIEDERKKIEELQRKADAEKNPAKKLALYQKQEAAEEATKEAILQSVVMEAEAAPERVSGMVVKTEWKFEVTDIQALFKAAPHCVKLESNDTVIRGMIAGGMRECAGLRIYEQTKTSVRL